ncbi:MAG: PD-(D/E)XK nuclease family transposase [Lachnospiraceae bacterium]|nr:PD-(D/E)XK nuclease family transposase [Lachnospiraceae bacterium]
MTNYNLQSYASPVEWPAPPETAEEAVQLLKKSPTLFTEYHAMDKQWRHRFLDFLTGKKSLPLTYDPFFKRIFHPDIHQDRLESLISSLLGVEVKIVGILPNEDSMLSGESFVVMDLLVQISGGGLCAVEIQKQPYAFSEERLSCYSADLLMRQYTRVRGERGKDFTYRDIKKVYVIVIYEKSSKAFSDCPDHYVHYGKTVFDTGLGMDLLQEYCLVSLDVFRNFQYHKPQNRQTAWLSLLATETLADADAWVQIYPWLEEIYQEIAMLRTKPREVLGMYSEMIRTLDHNTLKFIVEELQQKFEEEHTAREAERMEKEAAVKAVQTERAEKEKVLAENEELKKRLAKWEGQ